MHLKCAQLIEAAQKDDKIKVILLHGGRDFSSGNDLAVLQNAIKEKQDIAKVMGGGIVKMNQFLTAMQTSVKPIVAVVRGVSMGIGFTQLTCYDFIFASPDAWFMTPFMSSMQSPEGLSTLMFPKLFGTKLANEILMMDKRITAKQAEQVGFVNKVVPELQGEPDFFELDKVPAIGQLLATDLFTLTNCKRLLNEAKDQKAFEETLDREGKALLASWMDPQFLVRLKAYLKKVSDKKKVRNDQRAKL